MNDTDNTTLHADAVKDAARDYLARGWRIVPLKGKVPWNTSKNKPLEKWSHQDSFHVTTENFETHFNGTTTGVGVITNKLGDIDLDAPSARYIGPRIMPPTASFGRHSASVSHLVFSCVGDVFRDIQLPGDGHHIELRATSGHQTMFPGSMHPDNERVEWRNDLDPTEITIDELQHHVNVLAVACIFCHFYQEGNRDNLIVILSHVLHKHASLAVEDIQTVADAIMDFHDDTDPARKHKASKTVRDLLAGKVKPGLPKLADIIGKEWTDRISELLNSSPLVFDEPSDVFIGIATPPVPQDAVPEIALNWANDISDRANAPLECALFPLMVQVMNAAGSSVRIRLRPEWLEPPIFFSYVAVKSGSGKSPAINEAFRPLHKLNKEAAEEHKSMIELRQSIKNANDALPRGGEKEVLPEVPPVIRHMLRDATIEVVAERYDDNRRGLCNVHDELSMFANAGKRYGNAAKSSSIDEQIWCSMYDGGPIIKDRSAGKSIFTPDSCISIFGGIQPGRLSDLVHRDNEALGLVARFNLVALPKLPPVQIVIRDADEASRSMFEDRLDWLRANVWHDDKEKLVFYLTDDALFREEDERLRHLARQLDEPFDAHVSKYPGLLGRLILCFHLMTLDTSLVYESDTFGMMFEGVQAIPDETVEMAIRFLAYLHQHAVAIYKITGSTRAETVARDIAEVILKTDRASSITIRDLERTQRSNLKHKDEIIDGLDHLDRYDWGIWEPNFRTPVGRLSPRFMINPKVYDVSWQDVSVSCQLSTDRKNTVENKEIYTDIY